ncbi:MAG: hypothetical protein ACJ75A_04020, partial [Actinomycetes bacterium]
RPHASTGSCGPVDVRSAPTVGSSAGGPAIVPRGPEEARPYRRTGGIHLHGEVDRWRWDEGTGSIVSAGNFTLPG